MNSSDINKYKKAGGIARQVKIYARDIIKPGMLLVDIAEKIEAKIKNLGGKPAFPVNLSINEIAAHYTPSLNDETKAAGLLKVDIGVSIDGFVADTAFSLDLEDDEENKKLIKAAELALENAKKVCKPGVEVWKLGEQIHNAITGLGFSPVRNLSGHELNEYMVHSGINIPNYNNNNKTKLEDGAYAIEPFATTGVGLVYDGKDSGMYMLQERKGVRDMNARKLLDFIEKEYKTLPFCERWLVKKFGSRIKFSIMILKNSGVLHSFQELVEKSRKKVAQAEDTILFTDRVEIVS